MRKALTIVLILVLLVVAIAALGVFKGREVSLAIERSGTIEDKMVPIDSVRYEGNGTGGALLVKDLHLSLEPSANRPAPTVGSTKDGQLALAAEGKVFPFGPLPKSSDDSNEALSASPQPGDEAVVSLRHSRLSWPTAFELNFMTGHSPTWKRHVYQQLTWKKATGGKLEMLWRYEQHFYPQDGWTAGLMTRQDSTGLIKIEITN